jgi:hypothetical protein
METDPAQYVDGPDRYQFVKGNPERYVDPSGLEAAGSINLPGGPGKLSSGNSTVDIPGVGTVSLYGSNNNAWNSGGSAGFAAKISRGKGCGCKNLTWSQKVRITVNNRSALTDAQYYQMVNHETEEHGGNDPFRDYVPDNGYNDPKLKPDPHDPWAPPPMYKSPNQYAPPMLARNWPDPAHPFLPGDVGFNDYPWLPPPYATGADVTKEFILTLYCDGKPVGFEIHWSVRGVAGSGLNSTVQIGTGK